MAQNQHVSFAEKSCNSLRQQRAHSIYTGDNNSEYPLNIASSPSMSVGSLWSSIEGWVLGNAKLDTNYENLQKGLLWSYLRAPRLYKCPADRSPVKKQPRSTVCSQLPLEHVVQLL